MNLEKIKSFCAIVEQGSFSAAAEILYCSQAAISKQIKSLEDEIGFALFDRYGKKITLNQNGRIAYRYGKKILEELHEMQKDLFAENRDTSQLISFGATNFIGSHIITPHLSKFKAMHPDIAISFTIDFVTNILQLLLMDEFSFIFASECSTLSNHHEIITEHFCNDELILVVPPNHPWSQRSTILPEELATEYFLVSQPNSATRKFIDQRFQSLHISLNNRQNFYNIENIKQALLSGTGVSILPRNLLTTELTHKLLVEVSLQNISLTRKIFVAYKKNRKLSITEKMFIHFFIHKNSDSNSCRIE